MAEAALGGARERPRAMPRSSARAAFEQAKKEGKKNDAALAQWTKRTLVAAGTLGAARATGLSAVIAQMMRHSPQIAEWLRRVISFLTHG
jgi:hypothetical protein